ncbi:putative elongation factor 1B gamma, elongation factor EF1B gamma domain superfamily [Helianthus annuus]|nr:putative elongation factor 1B gamma, elongation factor EF1B gamma domain superfamily [Helianthus annuus]
MIGRGCTLTPRLFREVAIKGFWEMFDLEGYSLWFCNYNTMMKTLSICHHEKVGGFLQRMDLARKYAFGKMLIIGTSPHSRLRACGYSEVQISQSLKGILRMKYKRMCESMFEDHEPFEE